MKNVTVEKNSEITIQMLGILEKGEDISQRDIAAELGIALGATNAHIRRCMDRGLVQRVPLALNKHSYTLTQRGRVEKSLLSGRMVRSGLSHYTRARSACRDVLRRVREAGFESFYITGGGPLSEIAYLTALEPAMPKVAGVLLFEGETFPLPGKITHQVDDIPQGAAVLFTTTHEPAAVYRVLHDAVAEERLFIPSLLEDSLAMFLTEKKDS